MGAVLDCIPQSSVNFYLIHSFLHLLHSRNRYQFIHSIIRSLLNQSIDRSINQLIYVHTAMTQQSDVCRYTLLRTCRSLSHVISQINKNSFIRVILTRKTLHPSVHVRRLILHYTLCLKKNFPPLNFL